METPYLYGPSDIDALEIARRFPERTPRESTIMRDWVRSRGRQYTAIAFSVRIGQGLAPNPDHIPAIQNMTRYNTRMRIDILAWQGDQPEIIECKERVLASVLGQLLAYRKLFLDENPGAREPRLTAIGRASTRDSIDVLTAHGITVLLYAEDGAPTVPAA